LLTFFSPFTPPLPQHVSINSPHLLSEGVRQVKIKEFDLEGYPNRDSTPYPERYGIPEAQAVLRGTLRFKGNPAFVKAMVDFGIVNDDPQVGVQLCFSCLTMTRRYC